MEAGWERHDPYAHWGPIQEEWHCLQARWRVWGEAPRWWGSYGTEFIQMHFVFLFVLRIMIIHRVTQYTIRVHNVKLCFLPYLNCTLLSVYQSGFNLLAQQIYVWGNQDGASRDTEKRHGVHYHARGDWSQAYRRMFLKNVMQAFLI